MSCIRWYLHDKLSYRGLFLLTAKLDTDAALRFLRRAVDGNRVPDQVSRVTIDKSGANKAGLDAYNDEAKTSIEIRQCKYLNNRASDALLRPACSVLMPWAQSSGGRLF